MDRLRATLDEPRGDIATPTKFKTGLNTHQLQCGVCDELFYVDEAAYNRVRLAGEFDPGENPLRCADCEEEYGEEAR